MTGRNLEDQALETLFDGARASRPMPGPDFMARLAADAEANVPLPADPVISSPPKMNWLAGLFTASGLSGAAIAGVWIGFAMPDALDTLDFSADTSVALSTFLPSTDLGAVFDE